MEQQPTGHEPVVRVTGPGGLPAWGRPAPTECAAGHRLVPGRLSISWVGCQCTGARSGGHDLYYCHVVIDGQECDQPLWLPEV